jgi:hypothetical protein
MYKTVSGAKVEGKGGQLEPLKGRDFSVVFKWLNDNAKKH